jgi:hypothetical protein
MRFGSHDNPAVSETFSHLQRRQNCIVALLAVRFVDPKAKNGHQCAVIELCDKRRSAKRKTGKTPPAELTLIRDCKFADGSPALLTTWYFEAIALQVWFCLDLVASRWTKVALNLCDVVVICIATATIISCLAILFVIDASTVQFQFRQQRRERRET